MAKMKLHQNQLWQKKEELYRIVRLERLAVGYKLLDARDPEKGSHRDVTKKEFCRLIKGATDVTNEPAYQNMKDA